jgi:hypothetical protein
MKDLPPHLQILFEKTRNVCFGRFLIKIPSTATIVYGPAEVETPIMFYRGAASIISEYVTKRLDEIEEEREFLQKDDILKFPLFGKVIDGAVPGQKIIFGTKDQVSYTIYSYVPVGKDLFIQRRSVLPKYDGVPTLNLVASQLRPRSEDEIPAEPGTCIEGGFVPLDQKYERATIGIRIKEFPDVHLSIEVHKNQDDLPDGNSLKLLRGQAKEAAEADGLGAVFAQTKILRQQTRQLNKWSGEELALRTPHYKDDRSVHEFRFYSMGAIHDSLHPQLDVRLDTGLKGNRKAAAEPSLTDEEALMLWDKLINTIRVRQPSDASPAKTSPQVPLATLIRTGETCPQAGWWECIESGKIDGSRRRLLKVGVSMPPVLLVSESRLWQKLSGSHSVQQSVAVWKLVAYDDEPVAPPTVG